MDTYIPVDLAPTEALELLKVPALRPQLLLQLAITDLPSFPELDIAIAHHPRATATVLEVLVPRALLDPTSTLATSIALHPASTSAILDELSVHPTPSRELLRAIVAHPNTTRPTILRVARNTSDTDLLTRALAILGQGLDDFADLTSGSIPPTRARLASLLAQAERLVSETTSTLEQKARDFQEKPLAETLDTLASDLGEATGRAMRTATTATSALLSGFLKRR